MKSSELIREAKKHLKQNVYCCGAILTAAEEVDYMGKAEAITEYISLLLFPDTTLGQWIVDNGIADWHTFNEHQYEYRLRWLEHLAQQYEAKGD